MSLGELLSAPRRPRRNYVGDLSKTPNKRSLSNYVSVLRETRNSQVARVPLAYRVAE